MRVRLSHLPILLVASVCFWTAALGLGLGLAPPASSAFTCRCDTPHPGTLGPADIYDP